MWLRHKFSLLNLDRSVGYSILSIALTIAWGPKFDLGVVKVANAAITLNANQMDPESVAIYEGLRYTCEATWHGTATFALHCSCAFKLADGRRTVNSSFRPYHRILETIPPRKTSCIEDRSWALYKTLWSRELSRRATVRREIVVRDLWTNTHADLHNAIPDGERMF